MKIWNPLSKKEKDMNKAQPETERLVPELESDDFGDTEQTNIIDRIDKEARVYEKVMEGARENAKLDTQHYEGAAPSVIENLYKRDWQSDRNYGLCAAVCDMYQAVLLATCLNTESLYFVPTEKNDIDNKEHITKFSKWMVGPSECNIQPEVDDFIHNRVTFGFSVFYIYWHVWYEWVDKRIPKEGGGYEIKEENMRFEKGVMENVPNPVEDFLLPQFGKSFQKLNSFIHILHMTAADVKDLGERKIFKNVNDALIKTMKDTFVENLNQYADSAKGEKQEQLGVADVRDEDIDGLEVDLYCWYGMYKKNGKNEKYRIIYEPNSQTFLSAKPLRKITRSGKVPFVGGAFIRRPGFMLGKSLCKLIAPVVNAFNNVFNQKSDFQSVRNIPFSFHNPEEQYQKQVYDLEPGVSFPTKGDPRKAVYFPDLSASFSWAESDMKVLFELLERLTGAASYFLTTGSSTSGTATRDNIVEEKSETRFGLWVKRIQADIAEGITMLLGYYQDWMPPDLPKRVIGEDDGKALVKNLSIESLRGGYDARLTPDVVAGSQSIHKQLMMWGIQTLSQSMWLHPQMNPQGNYNLYADAAKVFGLTDIERYMGPQPKSTFGYMETVKDAWTKLKQGEDPEPPEPGDPLLPDYYRGLTELVRDKISEVDEEYKLNVDQHLFLTYLNMIKHFKVIQNQMIADNMAADMIGGPNGPTGQRKPTGPNQPPGMASVPPGGQEPPAGPPGVA